MAALSSASLIRPYPGARFFGVALVMGALLASRTAWAEPSAADRATARPLAQQGHEALKNEDYAVAADKFSRAEALVHAPTLLRDLARAQVGLGRFVEAQENYNRIIREGVTSSSSASWSKALADAKREVQELSARLPWVTISITGPAEPLVLVDGVRVGPASLGVKRPVDPGRHRIEVSAPGFSSREQRIFLVEGQSLDVDLELEPAPKEAAPAKLAVVRRKARPAEPPSSWRTPAKVVAFAVGGAGIVVGGVTGILAMNKRAELSRACTNGVCGEAQLANVDRYHTLATLSTIGFVVAGVGGAFAIVLLLTEPKEVPKTASAARWSPFAGPSGAGIRGNF
jgi:PEGA domain